MFERVRTAAVWCALFLLRLYKAIVSPFLPPACRFEPTCSEYAEEAIRRHGLIRGAGLSIHRLARCRPGVAGGPDPVPPSPRPRRERVAPCG